MEVHKEQKVIIQHYIPQCILSNFSNEKKQIYEGLVMEKKHYLTNITNSMAERYTYEHSLLEINKLEKYFSRIEDYIGPAFTTIIAALDDFGDSKKDFNEIYKSISRYIREYLIFYYRSGALLYEFSHDNKSEDRVLLMLGKLSNSEYIRRLSKTILDFYSFCIIKSNDGHFLLSDQFLSTAALGIKNQFANVSNRQIGFKKVIILIPISKNYYAVYFHGMTPSYLNPSRINTLDVDQIREINKIIINNSYKKSAGYNENVLKGTISEFKFHSPVTILRDYKSGITEGSVLKKEIFFYKEDEETMELFNSTKWLKYESLSRNDSCTCGSNKKFKKCHMNKYVECKRMMDNIKNNEDAKEYTFGGKSVVELPINEWSTYVDPPKSKVN